MNLNPIPDVVFALLLLCLNNLSVSAVSSTLRLVHFVHRHGDRSPTGTFPTDSHQEDSWPQGWGQLTEIGKQEGYHLGKFIRNQYDGFLNASYIKKEINVRSTDLDRTLMTAEVVLAGMYPPKGTWQEWNENINWQPVPVHTVPDDNDQLLNMGAKCDKVFRLHDDIYENGAGKKFEEENEEYLTQLRKNAGLEDSSLYHLMETVPDALFCEKSHNMTLPEWADTDEEFDKIMELKKLEFKFYNYDEEMIKLQGGLFFQEMSNHTDAFIAGDIDDLVLVYHYSAHDSTLATYMALLNVWNGLVPPYASVVIFELHEFSKSDYRIRLYFKNDTIENPLGPAMQLSIPGCGNLDCPYDDFKAVVEKYLIKDIAEKERLCNEKGPTGDNKQHGIAVGVAVIVILILALVLGIGLYCYKLRNKDRIRYQSANFSIAQQD